MSSQVPFGKADTTTANPGLQLKADDWQGEPLTFREQLVGMMPPTISLLFHTQCVSLI